MADAPTMAWEDLRTAATVVVMRAEQLRNGRPMPPEIAALERALEELGADGVDVGGDRKAAEAPQAVDPQGEKVVTACVDPCPYAGHCIEEGWCANGCEIRQRINSTRGARVGGSDPLPLPPPNLAAILNEAADNPRYQRADYARWMREASDALHAITKWAERQRASGVIASDGSQGE